MANYLALIRKADFVDLYKYGSLYINKDMTRQFSCKVEELPNRKPIFDDLSYFANAFDSTFTYLFIHYESNFGRVNYINIADVRGLYPLDQEAKTELSLSLDLRIKINEPLWPDAVFNLQKRQTIQDCKNGASNIWKIYKLSGSIEDMNNVINDNVIGEVVNELYENRRPKGELPIWVYIMRYERHAFYPNNTIGAFMDTVNAIFNFSQKREVDSDEIESTLIMQFFQHCNDYDPNMSFNEVMKRLYAQEDSRITNFINLTRSIVPDFDLIKVATLFFIYRNRYKEEFKYENGWNQSKTFGKEFSIACYMLGCILGHEHTYDCLYEHLPLAIFKVKRTKAIVKEPVAEGFIHEEQKTANEESSNPGDIIDSNDKSNMISDKSVGNDNEQAINTKVLPKFPCKMGKPKKGGGFSKSPKPKMVYNINSYFELESQGWKEIKEDKNLW
ncbi:MAG: hypothetical protein SPK34_07080 [Bacteroidaceae bacterium]|nr:hypothetical protein [Prevotellaceae bacterium]MDY5760678.1 hypothetical protein [Bacteroidaceae bacterium]